MQVLPLGVVAQVHRLEVVGNERGPARERVDLEAVVRSSQARVGRAREREAPQAAGGEREREGGRVRWEREVGSGAKGGRTLHPRRSRPPPSRSELRGRNVRTAQGECERLEGSERARDAPLPFLAVSTCFSRTSCSIMMLGPSCADMVMLTSGTHLVHRFMSSAWSFARPSCACDPTISTAPLLMTMVNVDGLTCCSAWRVASVLGDRAQKGRMSVKVWSNSSMRMTLLAWAKRNLQGHTVSLRSVIRTLSGRSRDAPVVEALGRWSPMPPFVLAHGLLERLALPLELLVPLGRRVRDEVVDRVPHRVGELRPRRLESRVGRRVARGVEGRGEDEEVARLVHGVVVRIRVVCWCSRKRCLRGGKRLVSELYPSQRGGGEEDARRPCCSGSSRGSGRRCHSGRGRRRP